MKSTQRKFIELTNDIIDHIENPTEYVKKYIEYVNLYHYNEYKQSKCHHKNTEFKRKLDSYPYGKDVSYTLCLDCGEQFNYSFE